MLRRAVCFRPLAVAAALRFLSSSGREALSKALGRVKEEAKGQLIDLQDMNEASRNVTNALQEALKRSPADDARIKGKLATLSASLKAYNTRLSNMQNEARSVQSEADAVLKLIWKGQEGSASAAAPGSQAQEAESKGDFEIETPPITKKLEQVLETSKNPEVEVVEGVFIREDMTVPKQPKESAVPEEPLEIELEADAVVDKSPAQTLSIPEITKELHEKDIDFTDCRDAATLRRRYQDYLDGKVKSKAASRSPPPPPPRQTPTPQPATPPPPRPAPSYGGYQNYQGTSSSTGLANDPYPGAERKMVDPMKYVSEIKLDIAREKNIDVNGFDLWSGNIRLEDHKRMYDYPCIQQYPIEVRSKGDRPSY